MYVLDGATIGELFSELAQVERKIRDYDPLLVSVRGHDALSPELIELVAREQQICDELARRRAGLRVELTARLQAMQVSLAPTASEASHDRRK
jgi:hypothetical protein